tara:strand:+ start:689 stop:886 length:198 start_codon:yes stop_codon:yes gene_type:complete
MSKIFNYAQSFLDDGGEDLGYSHYDLPNLDDMSVILENSVKVWEYHGMSMGQYYSTDLNEGKTMP